MHLQIISRQNCEANDQPVSTYMQSLYFTRNGNHGLLKRKKATILHLAVFIYCISVFFVCIVKNSHNKRCCDVKKCTNNMHRWRISATDIESFLIKPLFHLWHLRQPEFCPHSHPAPPSPTSGALHHSHLAAGIFQAEFIFSHFCAFAPHLPPVSCTSNALSLPPMKSKACPYFK